MLDINLNRKVVRPASVCVVCLFVFFGKMCIDAVISSLILVIQDPILCRLHEENREVPFIALVRTNAALY